MAARRNNRRRHRPRRAQRGLQEQRWWRPPACLLPLARSVGVAGQHRRFIVDIRALLIEDPKRAEELARADQERFPDSPDADERDALLVAAIYNQHQPLRARREARNYLRRHPHGRYAEELMHVTGARIPAPSASASSP
jgi:hypothetical protein